MNHKHHRHSRDPKFNSPHVLVVFWAVTKELKQQEFDLQFKQLDDYAEINRNYEVRKHLIRS